MVFELKGDILKSYLNLEKNMLVLNAAQIQLKEKVLVFGSA
jgi:hypothetical protein